MSNHNPAVSVVIPTFNRASLLVCSVESILNQTFKDFECIVVDDASNDGTQDLVSDMARKDERLRYYRRKARGFSSAARNAGLGLARGRFIAYHDDDDEWLPTKLEKQVALIESLPPEYGCVYCWADFCDGDGNLVRNHRPSLRGNVFAKTLVDNAIGCTPSLLIRREIAERIGQWNESIRTEEDNEYIIRLCCVSLVDFVPEVLVKVHTEHGGHQVSVQVGPNGLQRSLDSIGARYELFRGERQKYRKQAAALESRMANIYWRLGNHSASIRYFREAFKLAPLNWELYHMLFSLAKWRLNSFIGKV